MSAGALAGERKDANKRVMLNLIRGIHLGDERSRCEGWTLKRAQGDGRASSFLAVASSLAHFGGQRFGAVELALVADEGVEGDFDLWP